MRSVRKAGELYRTSTAQDPVIAAHSRAMNVVLHFHILELLSVTEDGVKGRIRMLVSMWMVGPRSSHGRKEGTGNPNLTKETQEMKL